MGNSLHRTPRSLVIWTHSERTTVQSRPRAHPGQRRRVRTSQLRILLLLMQPELVAKRTWRQSLRRIAQILTSRTAPLQGQAAEALNLCGGALLGKRKRNKNKNKNNIKGRLPRLEATPSILLSKTKITSQQTLTTPRRQNLCPARTPPARLLVPCSPAKVVATCKAISLQMIRMHLVCCALLRHIQTPLLSTLHLHLACQTEPAKDPPHLTLTTKQPTTSLWMYIPCAWRQLTARARPLAVLTSWLDPHLVSPHRRLRKPTRHSHGLTCRTHSSSRVALQPALVPARQRGRKDSASRQWAQR